MNTESCLGWKPHKLVWCRGLNNFFTRLGVIMVLCQGDTNVFRSIGVHQDAPGRTPDRGRDEGCRMGVVHILCTQELGNYDHPSLCIRKRTYEGIYSLPPRTCVRNSNAYCTIVFTIILKPLPWYIWVSVGPSLCSHLLFINHAITTLTLSDFFINYWKSLMTVMQSEAAPWLILSSFSVSLSLAFCFALTSLWIWGNCVPPQR